MPPLRKNNPDIEFLKSALAYVPETGQFFYRKWRGQRRAGSTAGVKNPQGYVVISVQRSPYLAHRLAIAFQTGVWPENNIDHINGVPHDNRLANLREVTQSLNVAAANMRRYKNGGALGIRFRKGKWEASIKSQGIEIYLGRYADKDDAQDAYLIAANKYHGSEVFTDSKASDHPLIDGAGFVVPKVIPPLTHESLLVAISYDPATGVMTRKTTRRYKGRESGRPIGHKDSEGYLHAKVGPRGYLVHRLVWFYMTGGWPLGEIHHINHDPGDNRWANLRDISPLENNRLRRRSGPIPKKHLQAAL